jgi:hypothetical protein
MKQSTKRLLSMVISLVLIGGAFVVFLNFIRPAYAEVQRLKSEVLAREQFVAAEQQSIRNVQQRISAYNNQAELRELFNLTLPLVSDVSGALTQFAGLVQNDTLGAQNFGVGKAEGSGEVEAAVAGPPKPAGAPALTRPLGRVSFETSFTASYENMKAFLEKLESNIRIFDVTSLTIVPTGKQPQDLYKVDVKAVTYYQKEK